MERFITPEQFGGIVRNMIMPLIVYLMGQGIIPVGSEETFLVGLTTLATLGWGFYANREAGAKLSQEQVYGLVRNLLSPITAYAYGKGWITQESFNWLLAGLTSASFSAWSWWEKRPR
jgi:ABC-type anion transport system duplicated permease subunit